MKSIYDYDDFRNFVNDRFEELRKINPKLTHREICKRANFKSSNTILLIIKGKRNLSRESALKLAKALELTTEQEGYFLNLCLLNQSKNIEESLEFSKKLLSLKGVSQQPEIDADKVEYFSNWYYAVIRELVKLNDFVPKGVWISERLGGAITAYQGNTALELLIRLKLIEKTNDTYKVTDTVIKGTDNILSEALKVYHTHMIKLAGDSILNISSQERLVLGLTFPLSNSHADGLKKLIYEFLNNIVTSNNLDEGPSEVYQLNIQLFPHSKKVK